MKNKSAICTLFEGNFHYGVGALTNSLYKAGFRGIIWAGYRGEIPFWAAPIKKEDRYDEFQVADGCVIRFIKLDTDYHLTNYKPEFMLDLWRNYCPEVNYMFYFDPDIVVKCKWPFFEEWAGYGIALCEDINSPIYYNHPLRSGWRAYFQKQNISLNSKLNIYINGGFIGLDKNKSYFLNHWIESKSLISHKIGDLSLSRLSRNLKKKIKVKRPSLFISADQDGLNITTMRNDSEISPMGKEAMGFIPGGQIMLHALGGNKPWEKNLILSALAGSGIREADKLFWKNVNNPIKLYSDFFLKKKRINLIFGAFLNRFFKR
jgi:hypothetical protein